MEIIDKNKIIKTLITYTIYSYSYLFRYISLVILCMLGVYQETVQYSLLVSLLSNIILIFVLAKIYWKDLIKEFKIFIDNFFNNMDTALVLWIIGLTIMVITNLILIYVFKSNGATNELTIQEYIKKSPIIMGINICITAPIIEEIIYRKAIKDFIQSKIIFVIFSFILFGSVHVMGSATSLIDYLYIIPYGALGACFAIMYNKTETVFTSITIHSIHNTLLFLISIII